MAKMAVVGEGDGILVFKAAGVDAFTATDEKHAREVIRSLAKEYAVIFITEELSFKLSEFLKRFNEAPYPAVLIIPGSGEHAGYGMEEIKRASERALGVDILFKD